MDFHAVWNTEERQQAAHHSRLLHSRRGVLAIAQGDRPRGCGYHSASSPGGGGIGGGGGGGGSYASPSSQSDPFPCFSRFLTDLNKTETASGWISDLELMHHYTSVSYRTFSHSSEAQKALQYDVPREALSYPFLLHQLLAFSAYHLAYLQPDCRHAYLMQAAQHQNDAINGMRGALLGAISPTNCHALFASSIFLTLSAFATYPSYEKYNPTFSPVDGMLDIFTLSDGMSAILRSSDDDIRKGPLREIFVRGCAGGDGDDDGDATATPADVEPSLQPLFDRLPRLSARLGEVLGRTTTTTTMTTTTMTTTTTAGNCGREGRKYTITSAIIALSESIAKVSTINIMSAPAEFRAVFMWPILLSTDYMDMLRLRQPAALVVLAHYCVIIHLAEPFCWFLTGWTRALVSVISEHLTGTPWEELVLWPMEIVGLGAYEPQLERMVHAMPITL
ncbi:hypothetical protein CTA2_5337 [Colletotrichum tanaceti]|uniref:Sterol uptake control protein 2 n=1 Tax=Colletotrichum tanaceti TaxID=1306861 RepID=A0A4U6XGR5_9PEZI|nr:hypothetical protein CTA2_5337 [Colletotrichum tanaceti]TKW54589.1 hypothetical protein CTA1_8991 [Colletotrichum tanaceti]